MKKAGLVILSIIPGLALAYALLTGYLMKRINPVPIATLPERRPARRRNRRAPVVA